MGNCLRRSADNSDNTRQRRSRGRRVTVGKNQPLKRNKLKWYSDIPLTSRQVILKREEFWDTAPAFEGRREIWDALRAAAEALEKNEWELAQAIVDGANIIVPSGTLFDCYDELGNRYQLPPYVLCMPNNLIEEESFNNDDHISNEGTSRRPSTNTNINASTAQQPVSSSSKRHSESSNTKQGNQSASTSSSHKKKSKNKSSKGSHSTQNPDSTAGQAISKPITFRLSTSQDFILNVRPRDTVYRKRELADLSGFRSERQRWYCCGQGLPDRLRIEDCNIPDGFIVQVIVHLPDDVSPPVPSFSKPRPGDEPLESATTVTQAVVNMEVS